MFHIIQHHSNCNIPFTADTRSLLTYLFKIAVSSSAVLKHHPYNTALTVQDWYVYFLFQVIWQFKEGNSFSSYPPEINYIIEKAYLNKEQKATWEESDGTMEIIMKDMIERNNGDPSTDVPVRRQAVNVSGNNCTFCVWDSLSSGICVTCVTAFAPQ